MTARIDAFEGQFVVRLPYSDKSVQEGRNIPAARWSRMDGAWIAKPYARNVKYFKTIWEDAGWSSAAEALAKHVEALYNQASAPIDLSGLNGVPFKLPPREHQKRALLLGRDRDFFAYLMEQGTGKTKVTLDDAAHNYRNDKIDALIVVAPNGVKTNWVSWDSTPEAAPEDQDQVDRHMAPDIKYHKTLFSSTPNKAEVMAFRAFEKRAAKEQGLVIIAVNYEALLLNRCFNWLTDVSQKLRVMLVFDESTRLKKPGSLRSKQAKKLRKLAKKVRILSGTPAVKRPLDLYNQFAMLDESILGFGSFYAYRNHFCNMGGFQGKQVLSYRNLDELVDLIAPHSFRVTKAECLDLPPKIYMPPRMVKLTKVQDEAYRGMKREFLVNHADGRVEATNVLAQMMRLQQITGGYVSNGEKIIELVEPDKNPKFVEALELIEQSPGPVIVWTRFTPELEGFCKLLEKEGVKHVRYNGDMIDTEKMEARRAFMNRKVDVFVGNPAAGGIGIDLYVAETVIYLSNGTNTEDRAQSEDRAHRDGTKKPVTYYDIIATGTEDVRVLRIVKNDIKMSDNIMAAISEWRHDQI